MGIANVEAMEGYTLADQLTPREFAELTGLDYEMAQVIYAAYAAGQEEYGQILGNLDSYEVPLIDMFLFVCEQVDSGIVTLDENRRDAGRSLYPDDVRLLFQKIFSGYFLHGRT